MRICGTAMSAHRHIHTDLCAHTCVAGVSVNRVVCSAGDGTQGFTGGSQVSALPLSNSSMFVSMCMHI